MVFRLTAGLLPPEYLSPSGVYCGAYYCFFPSNSFHSCTARFAYGEGARVANRLDFVSYRSETFTVDPLGNRNTEIPAHPRVILSGSSYSLGLSLSDGQTLSARLNQRLGPVVYNAANVLHQYMSPTQALTAARDLHVQNGWVLLEIINRIAYTYESGPLPASEGRTASLIRAIAPLRAAERGFKDPFAINRLSSFINMRLLNDRIFPSPAGNLFHEEELINGRPILYLNEDTTFFHHPHGEATTLASIAQFQAEVEKHGLKLAILLVPTAYTVYYPWIRKSDGDTQDTGAAYLTSLQAGIENQHIPVINPLPFLREAAAKEFQHNRLIWWPDDGHWNPRGVDLVAEDVAPWLKKLLSEP